MFPGYVLTRDGHVIRVSGHSLSLFLSKQLSVSLPFVLCHSLSLSHARSFFLIVALSAAVGATEGEKHRDTRNTGRTNLTALDGDQRAPPSLSRSRSLAHALSLVRSSPATMLDARRMHGPHGARRRTHARTVIFTLREDVTRPRCERQRQHHHRTLSWRPSFSGIQWRYRESRNVKRTRVHGCKCARALRACERTGAACVGVVYRARHAGAYLEARDLGVYK